MFPRNSVISFETPYGVRGSYEKMNEREPKYRVEVGETTFIIDIIKTRT